MPQPGPTAASVDAEPQADDFVHLSTAELSARLMREISARQAAEHEARQAQAERESIGSAAMSALRGLERAMAQKNDLEGQLTVGDALYIQEEDLDCD